METIENQHNRGSSGQPGENSRDFQYDLGQTIYDLLQFFLLNLGVVVVVLFCFCGVLKICYFNNLFLLIFESITNESKILSNAERILYFCRHFWDIVHLNGGIDGNFKIQYKLKLIKSQTDMCLMNMNFKVNQQEVVEYDLFFHLYNLDFFFLCMIVY